MSTMGIVSATVAPDGGEVALAWADGCRARFHATWLRDNAQDDRTRDPHNGQRLITVLDVPADTAIAGAERTADGGLRLRFSPDGRETMFAAAWLRAHIYDRHVRPSLSPDGAEPWDGALGVALPTVAYGRAVAEPAALAGWLDAVRRFGFAIMTGVPGESGAVARVAELFGYVRQTNYGRWFDVRSEVNPVNLAYTGLGLQVHTDNPYRDPVPTLQLLHCLASSAEGGDSTVVDGFNAAALLREAAPEDFALLTGHSIPFAYRGTGGVHLTARMPMIELTPEGSLRAVRFNNRSAAPLDLPFAVMAAYYRAYRRFAEILERPALEVSFKMAAGELFIVDNTRVLHGRKGFSGAGTRHLQGCYADKDGLLSTLSVLQAKAAEAAA